MNLLNKLFEGVTSLATSRTIIVLAVLAYIIVNPETKDSIAAILPDVLDILGEGNNPELILTALAALFRKNAQAEL